MRPVRPVHRLLLVLAALATLGICVAVATGAIPGSDGTITACYTTSTGKLRVIDAEAASHCRSGEQQLTWNQQGPAGTPGAAGPTGPTGPAGPAGAASCDPARLLVCPDADLPDGQTATLTIDGFPFLSGVHSFRASCTIANHCTIVLADTDPDALLAASAWYQQAETGVPQARRDFTIRVVDAGATQGTYFVSNGIPSAFLVDADHWQLTLTSERLQPVRG